MATFRFLEFQVYKDAKIFYKQIIFLTKAFPREYGELGDQMRRAALSICLNIAEGCAKRSDKDFNRYLENALGSTNEVVAGLDICLSMKLIKEESFKAHFEQAKSIANQLGGFSRKLLLK